MSNITQNSFDILVSSSSALGAINKSSDGSTFSISLDSEGLGVPNDAFNCNLQVISGELWYNTNNVISGVNNVFRFRYGLTVGSGIIYTVNIPSGLYSIDDIQGVFEREALLQYANNANIMDLVTNHRIKIAAESAQSKVIITFAFTGTNTYDLQMDFTVQNSIGGLLGFNNIITNTTTVHYFISPNVPKFNSFNYYLIQSDMCGGQGIRLNNSYNGIISKILVQAKPNSQLLYQPLYPTVIDTNNLIKDNRKQYSFSLLDDNLNRVNTNGEDWSLQLRINYNRLVNFNQI